MAPTDVPTIIPGQSPFSIEGVDHPHLERTEVATATQHEGGRSGRLGCRSGLLAGARTALSALVRRYPCCHSRTSPGVDNAMESSPDASRPTRVKPRHDG